MDGRGTESKGRRKHFLGSSGITCTKGKETHWNPFTETVSHGVKWGPHFSPIIITDEVFNDPLVRVTECGH